MMKIFKFILKFVAILLLIVIIAVIAIPTLFRGKIESTAKNIINENVNATVDFKNLSISLLKDFPNARLSLENLTVIGAGEFKGDTLASLSSFSASVSLWSLIKGKYDIKSIIVDNPNVYARVLASGKANWDIAKPDSTNVSTSTENNDEKSSDFSLSLKKFIINKANIVYDDESSKMLAGIKNLDLKLKGDFTSANTVINISTNTEGVSLYNGNAKLLSNLAIAIDGDIAADFANGIYTLKDNVIKANGMELAAEGSAKTENGGMNFDITYGLKVPSLKSLLALIPTSVVAEVKDIETKGDLSMNGYVKGLYNEKSMPVITLNLSVKDGYAKYAGFDEAISNINADADVILDKNDDKNSLISVSNFGFTVAENPFELSGKVSTPFTDANMLLSANGKIDFNSLKKCMPIVDNDIAGILNADLNFNGRMSQIEKEQYDKIKLSGNLDLNSFKMKMDGFASLIELDKASLTFNPTYCALNAFDGKMGSSDLHLTGRLENMLNYLFKGAQMKGALSLNSSQINCNDFMGDGSDSTANAVDKVEVQQQTAGTSTSSVIVLPSNVDFSINANIDKLIYDNLTMTNAVGIATLKEGKLNLSKLTMRALNGSMSLNGFYYAADESSADVSMKLNISSVKVADLANNFDIIGKFAPMMKNMLGKANVSLDFSSSMDKNMDFDYKSMNATGSLRTDSIAFKNSEGIDKLLSLLKLTGSKDKAIKDVNLNFAIKDGMIDVNPFDVKVGTVKMKVGGKHGINNDLDYDADVDVPAGKIGSELNSALSKLGIGASGSSNVKVGIKIGGNMTSPTFKLGTPKYGTSSTATTVAGSAAASIKETATAKIDSVKTQVQEKAKDVIDSAKNKLKETATDKLKNLFNKKKN